MAVVDLWHLARGPVGKCPECGQLAGPPSARHGRGLRWRVVVPGHPSESYRAKGQAERRETALWNTPKQRVTDATVDDMVAAWQAGKAGLAPKTRQAAGEAAQIVLARWSGAKITEVGEEAVQAWISGLQASRGKRLVPASASLRTKAKQCLAGALAIAVRRGLIPHNPASGVSVPKIPAREGRFLSIAELARLARSAQQHWQEQSLRGQSPGTMIWLMGTTGLRISEACALDVGSIDPRRRRVRVVAGKGGKSRNAPITATVLGMLDLDRPRGEPLFTQPRTGKRITPGPWRRRWFDPAVTAASLGDVRPHDLRHTAVSLAIHEGASIYDIQEMCGHSRPSTTQNIYGHLLDGHLDDVADRLDAALRRDVPGKGGR